MPIDTEAIKARHEAASEGPWYIGHKLYDDGAVCCRVEPKTCDPDEDGKIRGSLFNANPHIGDRAANNRFVAHARQDIPALLKEVGRLKRSMTDLVFAFGGVTLKDADDSLYEALEYQIEQLKQSMNPEKELDK